MLEQSIYALMALFIFIGGVSAFYAFLIIVEKVWKVLYFKFFHGYNLDSMSGYCQYMNEKAEHEQR